MIITCGKCSTSFRLDEELLKPEGSKVRCSMCKHVFVAYPPQKVAEPEQRAAVAREPEQQEAAVKEPEPRQKEQGGGIDLAELDAIFGAGTAEKQDQDDQESAKSETGRDDQVPGQPDVTEELDLDFDMELDPDGDTPGPETTQLDDVDFDLDFDLETSDLDFDFETDIEGSAETGAQKEQEPAEVTDEAAGKIDLDEDGLAENLDIADDLEKELDLEHGAEEVPEPESEGGKTEELELDLDFEKEKEQDEDSIQEPELGLDLEVENGPAEQELKLEDEDAVEELTLESEDKQGQEDQAEAELDFSDLENVLGEDDSRDDLDIEMEGGQDELKFELEDEPDQLNLELEEPQGKKEPELELESDSGQPAADAGDDLDDLEFQLDSEFDEKMEEAAREVGSEAEEELDLTDIEQMLEEGPSEAESPVAENKGLEDDLIIEDEVDLSELEQAIEEADKETAGDKDESLELELDLPENVESQLQKSDEELTLDISEIEQAGDDDLSSSTSVTMDSGDIDLQFEIEDEPSMEQERPVPRELENITETVQLDEQESQMALEPEDQPPSSPPPGKAKTARAPKKGVSKTLVFLLIIVMLGGIGYGLYYAVTEMGINIPYLSDYLKPEPRDPYGIMRLSTFDITSKFVENQADGRLFVITGKVRNGYDHPRAMIRLRGNLFTPGKKLVKTEYAYAGTVVTDMDLAQKPFAEIKKLLNRRPGGGPMAPAGTQPGQAVGFMVVFADLPENLEEFTVELVGSQPAGR